MEIVMVTKTDNAAHVGMHVFERAGLGTAPFRCVGYSEIVFQAYPGAPTQAGGSCDYCGTGIRYACHIQGRDGRKFKVGTDCVAKTGDAGLIKSYKNRPEVRAANRAKAAAKDAAVIAAWNALLADPAVVAKLAPLQVQGRPWVPGEMVPYLDRTKQVWGMCGASGRARTLKGLKATIAAVK
jgi:hypothetical protein